jgi:hypothetical protein
MYAYTELRMFQYQCLYYTTEFLLHSLPLIIHKNSRNWRSSLFMSQLASHLQVELLSEAVHIATGNRCPDSSGTTIAPCLLFY